MTKQSESQLKLVTESASLNGRFRLVVYKSCSYLCIYIQLAHDYTQLCHPIFVQTGHV